MNVLGISCFFHHDPAAALLRDGVAVAAAEEERFARVKHAPGLLPVRAAAFCLERAGLRPENLDAVAVSYSPAHFRSMRLAHLARTGFRPRELNDVMIRGRARTGKAEQRVARFMKEAGIPSSSPVHWIPHHLAHAGSAFLFSGFEDSAVMTLDGRGELDAGLLAAGRGAEISALGRVLLPDSLGMLYSAFTQYLGFAPNDGEYKLMAMAAYGRRGAEDLGEFLSLNPLPRVRGDGRARRGEGRFLLYPARFEERWGPPRKQAMLLEPDVDVAAAAQEALENAAIALGKGILADEIRRSGRLCLAGGVALNVKMNRALLEALGAAEVFVPPAASDAGTALGAAGVTSALSGRRPDTLRDAFLGPDFSEHECIREIMRRAIGHERVADLAGRTARLAAEGKIIGFFQGRMEFGPRALGNRSILAHPGMKGVSDRINRAVKFREPWRPFCPSVLREEIGELTGDGRESPYMTLSFPVRAAWRDRLSEVVHVDGTSRPQTVDRARCPLFYEVISRFRDMTGIPAVLNTSFNRAGEPVVRSPSEALDAFFGSGMDCLFLGPFLIEKVRA